VAGDGVLAFRAVGGDLQTFDGRWRVTGDDTSAQLSLEIEYVIPDGIGPAVPTFVAAAVMHEVFKTICQRVQEAVEAGCA
jgi:ribosome-associated toxin RatA of RatAB toxin-antitoxin module